jgi:hypothetical protein
MRYEMAKDNGIGVRFGRVTDCKASREGLAQEIQFPIHDGSVIHEQWRTVSTCQLRDRVFTEMQFPVHGQEILGDDLLNQIHQNSPSRRRNAG